MLTRKVFTDLAIFMMGFGTLIGLVFPIFTLLLGIPAEYVLQPTFMIMCVLAGLFVGGFNIFLARRVVGRRLRIMTEKMHQAESMIVARSHDQDGPHCSEAACQIPVDSDDALGEAAHAFNVLVKSLAISYRTEARVKQFTQAISSRLELSALCEAALDSLIEHSGAVGGMLITERSGSLSVSAVQGIEHPEKLLDNPLLWQVLKNNQLKCINLSDAVSIDALLIRFIPKELLFLPIFYKDVAVGVVILASLQSFEPQIRTDLELFASSLALALRNAITHSQLQELAANDPLTNIFNRRFGMIRLQEEYMRAIRLDQPLGVFMADLDHFKSINDTYGHLVGDRILVKVTQLATKALREGDVFLRYGGEEFLAVLPGASRQDTVDIANRFRRMVEDTIIHHGDQQIKTTISLGVASLPDPNLNTVSELIDKADKALYKAKDGGRNRVI